MSSSFYIFKKKSFTGRAHYSLSLRGTKCRTPRGPLLLLRGNAPPGNLLRVGSRVCQTPMSLRGTKCRGNLLSVGCCIHQKPMSLRASAHTGVAIRTPLVRHRKTPQKTCGASLCWHSLFSRLGHTIVMAKKQSGGLFPPSEKIQMYRKNLNQNG